MADYVKIKMPTKPKDYAASSNIIDKNIAAAAAENIWQMGVWSNTPEGHAFWSSVAYRLEQMAKDGK